MDATRQMPSWVDAVLQGNSFKFIDTPPPVLPEGDKRPKREHCFHGDVTTPDSIQVQCCHCGLIANLKMQKVKSPEHGYFRPTYTMVNEPVPDSECPGTPDYLSADLSSMG